MPWRSIAWAFLVETYLLVMNPAVHKFNFCKFVHIVFYPQNDI